MIRLSSTGTGCVCFRPFRTRKRRKSPGTSVSAGTTAQPRGPQMPAALSFPMIFSRRRLRPAVRTVLRQVRGKKNKLTQSKTPLNSTGSQRSASPARCSRQPWLPASTSRSPSRSQAIPAHLAGRDVLGVAQTGSGKTAAFSLPILTKIVALGTKRTPKTGRALILAPTRELAVQIEDTIRILAKGLHVSTALVLGGVSRSSQVKQDGARRRHPGRHARPPDRPGARRRDQPLRDALAGARRGRPHARHGLHQ